MMLLFSCNEEKNSKAFKNIHEKIDSISFDNEKLVIEKIYTKKSTEYNILFTKHTYNIPYLFIVGKDTIQSNNLYIRKLDSGENAFVISFVQGNATEFQYLYRLSEDKRIILNKIIILYSNIKGNIVNVDSIEIDKKSNMLTKEDIKKLYHL